MLVPSRLPRRLVFTLSAVAAACFLTLLTCVWCTNWGFTAPTDYGAGAGELTYGSPLQQRLASFGPPGRGGPVLWLWNLVDPAGARPECQALRGVADPLRTIAIVGNGPITAYQRQQIDAADAIIRFNKLDNWYCGDRMDVWVTRWANHVISKYHGIGEVEYCNTSVAARAASAVWVLDAMEAKHARQLAEAFAAHPPMRRLSLAKTVIDWPRMEALFHARLPDAEWNAVPSSGWVAMMLALECAPPRARVHLFGFNWSRRAWAAHKMGAEEAFARRLDAAGRIRIHWPACAGMRGCGGCAVVASYDERGGAVCVPRPPGPPGEGEVLRGAKFDKANAWHAEVDRLRPPRPANGSAPGAARAPAAAETAAHASLAMQLNAEAGEAGIVAAVRQHMADEAGEAAGAAAVSGTKAGAGGGVAGAGRGAAGPKQDTEEDDDVGAAGDGLPGAARIKSLAGARAATIARRTRMHRAMRTPRALRWVL